MKYLLVLGLFINSCCKAEQDIHQCPSAPINCKRPTKVAAFIGNISGHYYCEIVTNTEAVNCIQYASFYTRDRDCVYTKHDKLVFGSSFLEISKLEDCK